MDADMSNLTKGLASSTRRIVVYHGFEKYQSANYTIWSVVFVILYQTR